MEAHKIYTKFLRTVAALNAPISAFQSSNASGKACATNGDRRPIFAHYPYEGTQKKNIISRLTAPKFTKFLRYYIPFQNARAKTEGGQFRLLQKKPPKLIGYHSIFPWTISKRTSD